MIKYIVKTPTVETFGKHHSDCMCMCVWAHSLWLLCSLWKPRSMAPAGTVAAIGLSQSFM